MVYMDGHCNSDNQMHSSEWNLAYTGDPDDMRSDQWRVATFADKIQYANIVTQSHHMPQLMVRGWEWFFTSVGKRSPGEAAATDLIRRRETSVFRRLSAISRFVTSSTRYVVSRWLLSVVRRRLLAAVERPVSLTPLQRWL